jgi:hypothetical protein
MEFKRVARKQSRRSVLAGALRCVALGELAAIGVGTVAKRQRLIAEGKCINDGICCDCGVLAQCGLPEAVAAKEFVERGDNGPAK